MKTATRATGLKDLRRRRDRPVKTALDRRRRLLLEALEARHLLAVLLDADFSNDSGGFDGEGFSIGGPAFQWHLSTGRGNDPGHSATNSVYFGAGEDEFGNGTYDNNSDGTLSSPAIDLTSVASATLTFNHFLELESPQDIAQVNVVTFSGASTTIATSGVELPSATGGFRPQIFDLTPFVGETIQIQFRFQSDSVVTGEGWYIDDVTVTTPDPPAVGIDFSDAAGDPDAEGFTSSGPNDQWHLSTGRGNDPRHSADDSFYFGAGEGPSGGGAYDDNADGTLTSPTFDLSGFGSPRLTFNHFLDVEPDFDFATVSVVHSGGTDVIATSGAAAEFPTQTFGFQTASLDLQPFVGDTVQFQFRLVTDSSVTNEGWYIDDIGVIETAPTPTITGPSGQINDSSVVVSIDFGEPVTGFDSDDITVGGGTVTALVDDGNGSFTATIAPDGDGQVTVDIPAGVAQDDDSNNNLAATQYAVLVDTTAPTAADFVVNSAADGPVNTTDSEVTLRDAIFTANLDPDVNEITFAIAEFASIVLNSGEFGISESATITGPGPLNLTVDAGGNSRIFNIDDGDFGNDLQVTISGLAMTGGNATDGDDGVQSPEDAGGAIHNAEVLSLSLSTITSSTAAGGGGAIRNDGQLTLQDSYLGQNSAEYGGAIESNNQLTVTGSTITENTASELGGGIANLGFSFPSSAVAEVSRSIIEGNSADGRGGGIFNLGGLTVNQSEISGNQTALTGRGGGIYNSGSADLYDSTLSGNRARYGGGIDNVDATATVTRSTITGNTAALGGGGIDNQGASATITVDQSTVSGNSAAFGGGIDNVGATATITNSTFTGNTAGSNGGGIFDNASLTASTTVVSSIVAGNLLGGSPNDFGGGDVEATSSNNLVGDPATSGGLVHDGDGDPATGSNNIVGEDNGGGGRQLINTADILMPLASNGGLTQTHALVAGSPAIDAGQSSESTDQRGVPFVRDDGGGVDIGAFEQQAIDPSFFVVTTLDDVVDPNDGGISLREALNHSRGSEGAETITFDPALTDSALGTIFLRGEQLSIGDAVTIEGPGVNRLQIDASLASRVIHVGPGTFDVTFDGFRIVRGRTLDVDEHGAGVRFDSRGTLTLREMALDSNLVDDASGGAVFSSGGSIVAERTTFSFNTVSRVGGAIATETGTVTVTDSTLRNNSASQFGGGIHSNVSDLHVSQSTFSGNRAGANGGAFSSNFGGEARFAASTIVFNFAGGNGAGLAFSESVDVVLDSTIVGGNTLDDGTPNDIETGRTVNATSANNLISDPNSAGGLDHGLFDNIVGTETGDSRSLLDISTVIGPLKSNGGTTPTHAPLVGSPVIDAGVQTVDLITNGGFETGDFTGWTTESQGDGSIDINDGTLSFFTPIEGAFEALITQTGPSQNELFQSFTVPVGVTTATLSWSDRFLNSAAFEDPNQEYRVLIEDSGGNLIEEIFSTNPGDLADQSSPPNARSFDVTSLLQTLPGETIRLNFVEQDDLGTFTVHVDDVSLVVSSTEGVMGEFDQRGAPFARNDGGGVDIGAVELQVLAPGLFVVTTETDELDYSNGDVSLREAINSAAGSAGAEEITFDSSVSNIVLTQGVMAIRGNVAISGPGEDLLTIDGDGKSQIFEVSDDVVEFSNVTLSNLTLTGGAGNFGGAVTSNENLTILNSTITGNTATSPSGYASYGGGILSAGPLTVAGSTIESNEANYGGGIAFLNNPEAAFQITDSTISGNTANFGGGLLSFGVGTISGTSITGNSAATIGGGISNYSGYLVITESTISGNSSSINGGGIQSNGGLVVARTTISGNEAAENGGGVQSGGPLAIVDSTLSGNTAALRGGGLRLTTDSDATITSTTITDNDALYGGGVYSYTDITSLTIDNTIVAGNTSIGSTPDVFAPATIRNSLIGNGQGTIPPLAEAQPENGPDASGNFVGDISGDGIIDPRLMPLADNGGSTQTHALLPDSPAIDSGENTLLAPDVSDADDDGDTIEPVPFDQRDSLRISDGDLDGVGTVDIGSFEVQRINQQPTFSASNPAAVPQDSGAQTINFATFDPGDPGELNQSVLAYTVSGVSNPSLFLAGPLVDAAGVLTYTSANGASGTSTFDVTVQDDGGTFNGGIDTSDAQTFTITIDPLPVDLDFGDAPDGYPVTEAQDGARHEVGGPRLGVSVDTEADGQPSPGADGDGNDEDGVALLADLISVSGSDTTASFSVTASAAGLLDAWIDFNGNDDWGDAGEQIATSVPLDAGQNTLTFTVPDGAVAGVTAARFRISQAGGLAPTGKADDGEVEDYLVTIFDGGNDPNVTVRLVTGASTVIAEDGRIVVRFNPDLFSVPADSFGLLDVEGIDADETITLNFSGGNVVPPGGLQVDGSGGVNTLLISGADTATDLTTGQLTALNFATIDLGDAHTNVITVNPNVISALAPDSETVRVVGGESDAIQFGVPANWRMGPTSIENGRFVRSVVRSESAGGNASLLIELPRAWQNVVTTSDVNNSGDVTAGDALVIINELARRAFSDGETQQLNDPLSVAEWPGTYYDQNGDDRATALDALRVINELARITNSGGGEQELLVDSAVRDLFGQEETRRADESTVSDKPRERLVSAGTSDDATRVETDSRSQESQSDDETTHDRGVDEWLSDNL